MAYRPPRTPLDPGPNGPGQGTPIPAESFGFWQKSAPLTRAVRPGVQGGPGGPVGPPGKAVLLHPHTASLSPAAPCFEEVGRGGGEGIAPDQDDPHFDPKVNVYSAFRNNPPHLESALGAGGDWIALVLGRPGGGLLILR